jgi:hypothetical protein
MRPNHAAFTFGSAFPQLRDMSTPSDGLLFQRLLWG